MPSAALIYNPAAGRGRNQALSMQVADLLRGAGYEIEALPTHSRGSATSQARKAVSRGTEFVFAFGGDGTLREVACGLVGSSAVLGFIPGGTVNVMRRVFGLPRQPLDAARALTTAKVTQMDVGLVGDSAFLMQVSAGIDADFVRRLRPRLKRNIGQLALVPAVFGSLTSYRYPRLELRVDGRPLDCSLAVVSNIAFYGGPWRMSPEARHNDGRLHVMAFQGSGRAATIGFALDVLRGRHLRRKDVRFLGAEEISMVSPPTAAVQADGDALAVELPLEIRLAPSPLRVLMAG